ncbi:porin family protein [Myxococcota bacterium]|nr:porin family protein [Myxococcota bacterium]MBU1381518.1 porin family protein [Myxococcota bacterium]MBU1497525.1 porin family protein [Myxococcota bacterium]
MKYLPYLSLLIISLIAFDANAQRLKHFQAEGSIGIFYGTGSDAENLKIGPSMEVAGRYYFNKNIRAGVVFQFAMPDTKAEDAPDAVDITITNVFGAISGGWLQKINKKLSIAGDLEFGYLRQTFSGGGSSNFYDGWHVGIVASGIYKIDENYSFYARVRYSIGIWNEECLNIVGVEECTTPDLNSITISAGFSYHF